ncbi:hypothetical protein UFOVP42_33 [uncultured Caudovirales phage]|uniref:Uncharacterized protein n=1 Tax=uncultured Caudovirales phage TaxID=2100421 RepID=A0A6J5KM49_9CAUD|nr:hypothetical protein UFOVP42_33 [uncultured Caudovirales phage]
MAISTSGLSVPQLGSSGGIDTSSYGGGITVPKLETPKGMTIADMLDVSKKSIDLQKQKATQQSDIEKSLAESKRVQTEAEKAGLDFKTAKANTARSVYGAFLNDPDFINGNKDKMVQKLTGAKKYLNSMGLVDDDEGAHGSLIEMAQKDPTEAFQAIRNGVQAGGGAAQQYQSLQGAQNAPIQNQQSQGGNNPQANPQGNPQANPQGSQQPAQPVNVPEYSKPVPLLYPPRQAGVAYAPAPSEVADKDAGIGYRNNLATSASNITTARNNLDEVIKQADKIESEASKYLPETGAIGSFKRKFAELTGDTKYQMLSKDLANVQLANMKVLGTLGTNEGLEAQKAASGTLTYGPDVLKKIAERTKGDLTNIAMQSRASQKFANQFGDNNMKAFQQEWANNADTKVFQIINIADNPKLSKQQKQDMTSEILGTNDPEALRIFDEKYKNIRKLEKDGKL